MMNASMRHDAITDALAKHFPGLAFRVTCSEDGRDRIMWISDVDDERLSKPDTFMIREALPEEAYSEQTEFDEMHDAAAMKAIVERVKQKGYAICYEGSSSKSEKMKIKALIRSKQVKLGVWGYKIDFYTPFHLRMQQEESVK